MFEKKVWNDRQSEHPARRRLTPTENDNEYEVSRAEGLVMEEGDAFDATTMNDLETAVRLRAAPGTIISILRLPENPA